MFSKKNILLLFTACLFSACEYEDYLAYKVVNLSNSEIQLQYQRRTNDTLKTHTIPTKQDFILEEDYFSLFSVPEDSIFAHIQSIQQNDTTPCKKDWRKQKNWENINHSAGQGVKRYRILFIKPEDF